MYPLQKGVLPTLSCGKTFPRLLALPPTSKVTYQAPPHTYLALLILFRTGGQLLSYRSSILPRYLKLPTTSVSSDSSSPIKLNVASEHFDAIATSHRLHLISVFLSHLTVLLCRMSRPTGM